MGRGERFLIGRPGIAQSIVWRGVHRRKIDVAAMAAAILAGAAPAPARADRGHSPPPHAPPFLSTPVAQRALAIESGSPVPTTSMIVSTPNADSSLAVAKVKGLQGKVQSELVAADAVVADLTPAQLRVLSLDGDVVLTPNAPAF